MKKNNHTKKKNICSRCKKEFRNDNEKYYKVKYRCHYTAKHKAAAKNNCNLKSKIPKGVFVVFQNVSKYDYHFVIKDLAQELKDNLNAQDKRQKST